MKGKIAKVVFNLNVDKEFDYFIPESMDAREGFRVWVEFNRSRRIGLITKIGKTSKFKELKPVLEVLDKKPTLSKEHINFAKKLREKYPSAYGEFVFMMIPEVLRRRKKNVEDIPGALPFAKPKDKNEIFLIMAGNISERIKVYKEKLKDNLKKGSVIICLPSISYLDFIKDSLTKEFSADLVVFHSYQKSKEFLTNWIKAKQGKKLILGMRGALFYYPLDLSLVVIEEEASPYYFHPEKPYYVLFDIAYLLYKHKSIDLILSTDYPTLDVFKLMTEEKLKLRQKERKNKPIEIVRAKTIVYRKQASGLNPLIEELIRKNLEEDKKMIIFYNRRGFCSIIRCSSCGYVYRCPRCLSSLKLSLKEEKAVCMWCNYKESVGSLCKICNSGYITNFGMGIEKLERQLSRHFSHVKINTIEEAAPDSRILLSTYAVLDSPALLKRTGVDVGFVLDSDYFLSRIDFEASLRLYIYLKRLSFLVKEKVCVFTLNPDHYLWEKINSPWREIYEKEVYLRKEASLPPYIHLAKITLRDNDKNRLLKKVHQLYNILSRNDSLNVFGPVEEIPFKLRGKFHYSLIVKAENRSILRNELKTKVEPFRRGSVKMAIVLK